MRQQFRFVIAHAKSSAKCSRSLAVLREQASPVAPLSIIITLRFCNDDKGESATLAFYANRPIRTDWNGRKSGRNDPIGPIDKSARFSLISDGRTDGGWRDRFPFLRSRADSGPLSRLGRRRVSRRGSLRIVPAVCRHLDDDYGNDTFARIVTHGNDIDIPFLISRLTPSDRFNADAVTLKRVEETAGSSGSDLSGFSHTFFSQDVVYVAIILR